MAPDLLFIREDGAALVIECKYSDSPDYYARRGLAQTALYMLELRTEIANSVEGMVVIPEGVAADGEPTESYLGNLSILGPDAAAERVLAFVMGDRARR